MSKCHIVGNHMSWLKYYFLNSGLEFSILSLGNVPGQGFYRLGNYHLENFLTYYIEDGDFYDRRRQNCAQTWGIVR